MDNNAMKGAGTKVFKKSSPDGMITTYLGKRDFLDHQTHVDVIDGMVLVESAAQSRKVYARLAGVFRYGREDLDVLGLLFRKDLVSLSTCVYSPDEACDMNGSVPNENEGGAYGAKHSLPLTRLQERLKKKLGPNAYPFWFVIPPNSASSVTLQPAPNDSGKPCGVDYEITTYVADGPLDRPKKWSSVQLAIRKLTYAPPGLRLPQPAAELSKDFLLSQGTLHLEATLDREMYYHGESIAVNVHVRNNSSKTVKKVKVSVTQLASICLFAAATYSCDVAKLNNTDGCPVHSGGTLTKIYTLCPSLVENRDKRGLALDGKLKHEDTNLASSTIKMSTIKTVADSTSTSSSSASNQNAITSANITNGSNPTEADEHLGIIVQYKVRVRLVLSGAFSGEVGLELPFILTHPKPPPTPNLSHHHRQVARLEQQSDHPSLQLSTSSPPIDVDLIQLDESTPSRTQDDDIIFEDFARLRLKGTDSEELD